jgi:hypothetical protein
LKQECTSTSERRPSFGSPRAAWVLIVAGLWLAAASSSAWAEEAPRTQKAEEDDYETTPALQYGEFNEQQDEDEDTRFFQSGRFFGLSLGTGIEGATGNRGVLWQGGFPVIDLRVHYWFDFNFALSLGFHLAPHFYEHEGIAAAGETIGASTVSFTRVGVDVRYYFDMKDVTAAIAFANPYIQAGVGSYSKTETNAASGLPGTDAAFGLAVGGGLEFVLLPRKTYFQIDGKLHMVSFQDVDTTRFDIGPNALSDLSGFFYTITGSLMFTW